MGRLKPRLQDDPVHAALWAKLRFLGMPRPQPSLVGKWLFPAHVLNRSGLHPRTAGAGGEHPLNWLRMAERGQAQALAFLLL